MKLLFTITAIFLSFNSFSSNGLKTIKIDKKKYYVFPFTISEDITTYEYLTYKLKSSDDTIADLLFYSNFLKTPAINIVMYFNDKKSIAYKGQFIFGKESGWCETFHKDGNPYYKYFMKNGKMNGKRIIYYKENEDSIYTISERYFLNDTTVGDAKLYLENGITLEKLYFKNGCPDSIQTIYYENGKIKELWNYSTCKLNGEQLKYYLNGNVKTKSYWINGNVDSIWTEYYEDGKISTIYYYKDGARKSKTEYFSNGIKKLEGSYEGFHPRQCMVLISEDDLYDKNGEWKYWNEDEKLIKVEVYKKNILINVAKY